MASHSSETHPATGWKMALHETLSAARDAIQRFPVTTLFLLLCAFVANLEILDNRTLLGWIISPVRQDDLILSFAVAALASFAATLFAQAHRFQSGIGVLLGLVAGILAFVIIWPGFAFASATTEWAFVLALAGLVPVAPFIGRGSSASFWLFGARLVFAGMLGLLALGLFGGGISAILASLSHLFGLPVSHDLYQHVWASIGLFIAPLFAMGQTPQDFETAPGDMEAGLMKRGMRALGDFAAVPILIVYAVILHLYAAKIVITWSLPDGQVGWLVLTYGFCIFAVLILTRPFMDTARAPTRFFVRFWPLLMPVPLVLLFYALAVRLNAYGVTVDRFLLGLFGVISALLVLAQILPRLRGDTRLVAALPVAALLLASFGPQGAISRSIESQTGRFLAIVNQKPVSPEAERDALSILRFLNGKGALDRVAPNDLELAPNDDFNRGERYRDVAQAWGLDPEMKRVPPEAPVTFFGAEAASFPIDGFDRLFVGVRPRSVSEQPFSTKFPDGREVRISIANNELSIAVGKAQPVRFKVSEEMILSFRGQKKAPATIALEAEGRRVVIVPSYLYAAVKPAVELQAIDGILLLRSADWP